MQNKKNQKTTGRRRLRKLLWLLLDVGIVAVLLAMLFYKPPAFRPVAVVGGTEQSTYLTNYLLPQLYNGAQAGKPYHLTLTQQGIMDIVAHSDWPQHAGSATVNAPSVAFEPGRIILMTTVTIDAASLLVTVVVEPAFTRQGLLHLHLAKVKVGAANVTPLARLVARKMYDQYNAAALNADDIRQRILASLINEEPFDPVLTLPPLPGSRRLKVRIRNAAVENEKLTLHLVPLED